MAELFNGLNNCESIFIQFQRQSLYLVLLFYRFMQCLITTIISFPSMVVYMVAIVRGEPRQEQVVVFE